MIITLEIKDALVPTLAQDFGHDPEKETAEQRVQRAAAEWLEPHTLNAAVNYAQADPVVVAAREAYESAKAAVIESTKPK